ncbi:PspC domain-containing protein [Pedobacter polaris]|uniref:PspC domain-containing protein n=1 Tax=Pedobacter polaris TaxID=2571273 RepID=A0A4U1CTN3_9SPHI|nr:PspC domain-containing protein [Pedobacter polaris]TKC12143.1 PspC domain-containing protein [Pedobacter polaris]
MKKTIIINIGNSIIHIEEDAYEILTAYLNEIKHHFTKNADDFEIVTDIENRIAEMFAEILAAGQKQVIEITDVQSVIAQMGRVQDFMNEDEEEAPKATYSTAYEGEKKLYRDTDEGVIAGVCAGLGYYLNIETRWVRLIAFLSILLSGAGILAYIILWVVMPRAITRSEKMAMKGEATNLYGYKKSFEEELAAFNEKMKAANEHFQPLMKNSGNFITELIRVVGTFITVSAKAIMKFIAGVLIVCGFITLLSLIICLAGFIGFWDADMYRFPFSIINEGFRTEILFGAFITIFIPVLALVLFAIRVAFNKKAINKTVSFALLIIWLLGVSSTVYYATKISSEFQEHAELVQSNELKTYPTYVIDVDKGMEFSREDSLAYNIKELDFGSRVIVNDDDDHPFRVPRNVRIEIEKSENGKTSMVQTYESQGKTFPIALRNAQNIDYKYTQKDSLLTLSPRLRLKRESVWRNQEVHISLKVPVGTHLFLNDNIYNYLQFYYYSCNDDHNERGSYREWIMTEDGLKCKAELNQPTETNP